jgi:hypothetical protein
MILIRRRTDNGIEMDEKEKDMASLIDETPEAKAWVDEYLAAPPHGNNLGRLVGAVIWTDGFLENGEPLGGSDPSAKVAEINDRGWPLTHGHDPGLPAGRVIAARVFKSPSGTRFIAAILAYYEPEHVKSFTALGVDPTPSTPPPESLPVFPGFRIQVGIDQREVADPWVEELFENAPVPVERVNLSHNAADPVAELIRIGLPFTALVWNPLVKTIGEQAGRDIYAGIARWLQKLWEKLKDLRDPIVEIQSHHNSCTVSFLLRGRDVKQHYDAHAALSSAAVQAAKLIDNFEELNARLISLVYEFEQSRWVPSFGVMEGGQIVSDRGILIAYEQVPKNLSMGLLLNEEEAERKRPPQIFISHAFEDTKIAQQIAETLSRSGQNVKLDASDLAAGESLHHSEISKSIAASDYLLVLLSTHSVRSPWVQSELEGALRAEMNDRAITVIPVLLDRVELPSSVRNRMYIDLSRDQASGIVQLQRHLAAAPDIDFSSLNYSSFEALVAALLSQLGFEIRRSRPEESKDAGFDFSAISQGTDPFGNEETIRWLVQCKLYKQERVSVTLLQRTSALLGESSRHDRALVVTNGRLNSVARNFIADSNKKTKQSLRIIDGNELTALLLRYPQLISEFFPRSAR